jgi:PhoH-like ATPase
VPVSQNYTGFKQITDEELALYYETKGKQLPILNYNEFIITSNGTKLKYKNNELLPINGKGFQDSYIGKVKPQNDEQQLALDLLLDYDVKCVVLTGQAGCGKTFLTAQAGLYQVNNEIYEKIFYTRNHVEVGKPLGALPGDILEKIKPYCSSIVDQISGWSVMYNLIEKNMIEIEAISFLQGRDLKKCFIIIDEAQNINKEQVKMLLTRVGEGSKIILCGDLEQIAHNDFKNGNNGLQHLIDNFVGETELFGMIQLQHSVRSDLARLAAKLL